MGLEEIRKMKEQAGMPKVKQQYVIPKKSAKKLEKEKNEREERGDNNTDLQKWFKARIKYSMKGVCEETGLKTETHVYQYAIMSCCHILEKRNCPSVMYHPQNFIELIPDMHHKFDNISWEEREKWACWPVIRDRLIMVYPDLDPSERRFFPESVLKYMKSIEPF